jgi:uncharacterized membrane protein
VSAVRRPGGLRLAALVLAVLGLGIAGYLTYVHYSGATPVCEISHGCEKVQTSEWSKLAGVPVALLGLLFFVAMTALCTPWAWRAASGWVSRTRLAGAGAGVAMVLYLVWAELFRIDAICLWCTVVHGATVALFGVLVLGSALRPLDEQ